VQLYAQKDNGRQKKRRRKRFSVTEEEDSGPEEEEEKGCRDWAVKNRAHTHTYLFLLFGIRSKICGSMSISSL
jgi:hypothetical protein